MRIQVVVGLAYAAVVVCGGGSYYFFRIEGAKNFETLYS
jgi:hypothetical protein